MHDSINLDFRPDGYLPPRSAKRNARRCVMVSLAMLLAAAMTSVAMTRSNGDALAERALPPNAPEHSATRKSPGLITRSSHPAATAAPPTSRRPFVAYGSFLVAKLTNTIPSGVALADVAVTKILPSSDPSTAAAPPSSADPLNKNSACSSDAAFRIIISGAADSSETVGRTVESLTRESLFMRVQLLANATDAAEPGRPVSFQISMTLNSASTSCSAATLPDASADDLDHQLQDIRRLADANSLAVQRLKAGSASAPDPVTGARLQPVHLQVSGDFNGFYAFLSQMELEREYAQPPVMHIRTTGRPDGEIEANLTLELPAPASLATGNSAGLCTANSRALQTDPMDPAATSAASTPVLLPLSALRGNPFRRRPASVAAASSEHRHSAQERAAALKAVQDLDLQSVILAPGEGACIINNVMYHEGQRIEDFTVETIMPNSVVVCDGVYRFELKKKG